MRKALCASLTLALLLPGTSQAQAMEWGNSEWGASFWGAGATSAVPALGVGGLILLAVLVALAPLSKQARSRLRNNNKT